MARPKHSSPGSKQTPFYLSPREQYLIDTIQRRREDRTDARTGRSEIVVDALRFLLEHQEGVNTELIDQIMDAQSPKPKGNLKHFPTPGSKGPETPH